METKAKTTAKKNSSGIIRFADTIYQKGQHIWTSWMAQKAAALTHRQLIMVFCLFTMSVGAFSLLRLYQGLTGAYHITMEADRISTVIQPAVRGKHRPREGEELLKIRAFRKYMDSLTLTENGRRKRDSIITARPGLLDSVASIEAFYKSKLNN